MVHIEKDLGKGEELVTIKIMTPYPPRKSYKAIQRLSIGKIETLEQMQFIQSTLTKLQ
jgi:hypothetical protein